MLDYKGFKIESVLKLKGEFSFSANNKEIKIINTLFDVDTDNYIKDEAIIARDEYAKEVAELKSKGEKVSPSKVKINALEKAKAVMISKIGEDTYYSLRSEKVSKRPQMSVENVPQEEIKQEDINTEVTLDLDEQILLDEFDNDGVTETVKIEQSVFSTLSDLTGGDNAQIVEEDVEVVENLDIFDVEIDLEGLDETDFEF